MSIRIMHVVDNWAVGGLQNGVTNLIERMDHNRFEHVICGMRPVDESNLQRTPAGNVRVVRLSREESSSRFQLPALTRKIQQVSPDVVHTRNWGTFEAQFAARRVGRCARVHSEHGIDWDTTAKEPLRRRLCRRLAFQMSDRVLCVSRELRDLHARRTGFPANRVEVIHNGVDNRRFRPDVETRLRVRRDLGIEDGEFCIGCVGNLIPVKDHRTLLRAVNEFARSNRPWRLMIAGDGPERTNLSQFVNAHMAWRDRVLFLGRHREVPELLNAFDVYVLPSLTEGISNSLLEAMATGLAVIATATGGNPEVVVDGESGLLFPVGNHGRLVECLVSLATRGEWRVRIGQEALRRVREEFSIDRMVRGYECVYESIATPAMATLRVSART